MLVAHILNVACRMIQVYKFRQIIRKSCKLKLQCQNPSPPISTFSCNILRHAAAYWRLCTPGNPCNNEVRKSVVCQKSCSLIASTVNIEKVNPPCSAALSVTECLEKLDASTRPGLPRTEFMAVITQCAECGLITTRRVFEKHECARELCD